MYSCQLSLASHGHLSAKKRYFTCFTDSGRW